MFVLILLFGANKIPNSHARADRRRASSRAAATTWRQSAATRWPTPSTTPSRRLVSAAEPVG